MGCPENRPVRTAFPQFRNRLPEVGGVHVTQHFPAEVSRNLFHLRRNCHIVRRQVGMAALGVSNAKAIACFRKIKGVFPDHRFPGVGKVDPDKAAYGADHLIHESALLAEVDILGKLSDLGNLHCPGFSAVVVLVDDRADQHLKRRRRGKTAAAQHI